jgi:hypothetical protein
VAVDDAPHGGESNPSAFEFRFGVKASEAPEKLSVGTHPGGGLET